MFVTMFITAAALAVRTDIVMSIREMAMRRDFAAFRKGPGLVEMVFTLNKWSFADFYRSNK